MAGIGLKNLDLDALKERLGDLKGEHFNLRFQKAIGKLENYRKIRTMKRDIARVQTEISKFKKDAED